MIPLAKLRAEVFGRALGRCERCRTAPASEMHHRVTRARGGPDDAFNCVALCDPGGCHDTVHAENEHPWLVRGSFLRGRYVGPDEEYRARYP